MNYKLTLSILLFPLMGLAQPVLDANSFTLTPGTTVTVNLGPLLADQPGGANAVWDHSTLTTTASTEVTLLDPIGSGLEDVFTTATLVTSNSLNQSAQVYQITSSFVDIQGVFSVSDQVLLNYVNNPRRDLIFPCTFGTTWSDSFSGEFQIGASVLGTRTGTIEGEVDGFGDLILPFGTITNVLRVHLTETNSDNTVNGTSTANGDRYQFYKPGLPLPLLETVDFVIDDGTTQTVQQRSQWLANIPSALQETLMQSLGVNVYPNPARSSATIQVGAKGTLSIQVFDALGQIVNNQTLVASIAGIQEATLDLGTLTAGIHIVRVTDANGNTGNTRLVIE